MRATHEGSDHCRNDFNGDTFVDITDVSALLGHFGENVIPGSTHDLAMPPDGYVDISDVSEVTVDFGLECYGASEEDYMMSVGGDGLTPLTIFTCSFYSKHVVLGKTPNTTEWGYAYITMSVVTWCVTDQDINYQIACAGQLEIQYDTPTGPWYHAASTGYNQVWGAACKAWTHESDGYFVQRGQMLRDRVWHQVTYTPTGETAHGPHYHTQWYQWIIP